MFKMDRLQSIILKNFKGIFIPQDPMKIKRDIKSSGDLVIPDICLENVPKVKGLNGILNTFFIRN